ncbi:MAG: 1-phosphofructokinase family hexose kinase [Christensenellaceae bacterium]|jgi:1-phosphofructokinase|nr:1-phosphofructokinase family hexose kinase [Christensenellaceae bacterium]
MITGVCLNPCIDKTVHIERFEYGGMNRIRSSRIDGGGKGIHIALGAQKLQMQSLAIGLIYEANRHLVTDRLDAAGVPYRFVSAPGEIRTNLKIFDEEKGVVTEVNEAGPQVSEERLLSLRQLSSEAARESRAMVFTGSLPPGAPNDFYQTLIEEAGSCAFRVLDAEGERLRAGLLARPELIKPNSYELETLTRKKLSSLDDLRLAAVHSIGMGAGLCCVTMGSGGALLTDGKRCVYAPSVEVPVRSTVGAGDSVVCGLLYALLGGADLAEALRTGVAAGTAAVMSEGTQLFDRAGFEEMLKRVKIQEL